MKKAEIIERVNNSHQKLENALNGLAEEQASRPGFNPDWSIKDAISHIVAWEKQGALTLGEIQAGTWQAQRLSKETIDSFNAAAVAERSARSFSELREEFASVHQQMLDLIGTLPEEIEEASPMYKYIEGVTFRHMNHHAEQIEQYRKQL